MKYDMKFKFECPKCGKELEYNESLRGVLYNDDECVAMMSRDCHGIPFRTICLDCYEELDGDYDGEYYTEADECLDWDY